MSSVGIDGRDSPLDAMPYWTAKMYKPGGGQDHLGLGSVVTDRILPRLSPGINVLTIHPRYWSFYAFVLSEFWARDLPRTKAALRDWYRLLECIYSVRRAACATDPTIAVLQSVTHASEVLSPASLTASIRGSTTWTPPWVATACTTPP